jgi:hypothetical protein
MVVIEVDFERHLAHKRCGESAVELEYKYTTGLNSVSLSKPRRCHAKVPDRMIWLPSLAGSIEPIEAPSNSETSPGEGGSLVSGVFSVSAALSIK